MVGVVKATVDHLRFFKIAIMKLKQFFVLLEACVRGPQRLFYQKPRICVRRHYLAFKNAGSGQQCGSQL